MTNNELHNKPVSWPMGSGPPATTNYHPLQETAEALANLATATA